MSKRYVLFYASSDLSDDEIKRFSEIIKGRFQTAKVIPVKKNPRAVVIRTTNQIAPILRDMKPRIEVDGVEFISALTSGAIGNLKKRASEAAANGKVP
ncbi:MAG TPA: hypothetical protein VEJ19_02485 [Nitrososphaerales archaeon]|nr:hypothetical protein [Nitrososphaerales archaeon]